MNRYPLWKYLFIGAVLLIGLLYAVPNLFGEVPAVQVSPVKAILKVDSALMTRVDEALTAAGIESRGASMDPTSIRVQLADLDTQKKAQAAILEALNRDDYVVALNMQPNVPGWMAAINALPMYLGLDLRGGVHFLLQVDMDGALVKAADRYAADIRQLLRDKNIRYAGVTREGKAVQVRFRDEETRQSAATAIGRDLPDLVVRQLGSGTDLLLVGNLKPEAEKRIEDFALQQNITTLRNRVNELGVSEPIVQQSGADRVVVQLPGVQDTAKAKEILGRTATLEVRMVDEDHNDPSSLQAAMSGSPPFGSELLYERGGVPLILRKQVVLTGDSISDAQPGFDQSSGEPAVHINLDGKGARVFQQITRENIGKRMAMVLVEKGKGEIVTAPVIRAEIGGGRVQISGRMTTQEAKDVALLLRAGALAAPMEIVEERTVGPSLGAENITKGWKSLMIGFGLLTVFMVLYYAFFGVVSVVALSVNLILLVALLSMLQATLTLPGIAAIALTLGMAIDANVLINERIREELRSGTTPQAAIAAGYDRAWNTILDSNITTLIAGIALFMFGSGPVRGFAVVHCLGILTSMFSAVLVSRAIVNLIYGSRRKLDSLPIGNTDWHKRGSATPA
ncbi:MAG: protein translocase subunit SecD [Burkholderiales bacterium]|nr:protein translocase subunit SecD [Burkholderiales bacterium]